MKEYLKCCKKFIKGIWQINGIDLKIEYYKKIKIPRAEDELWERIYQGHINKFESEREKLVEYADDILYEMEEKGLIK